jgi:hypothetical protein
MRSTLCHRRVSGLADAIAAGEQLGGMLLKATTAAVRGRPDLASVYRSIDNPAEPPKPEGSTPADGRDGLPG